jgi:hypothetical protein
MSDLPDGRARDNSKIRDDRDWVREKYARIGRGERMPTNWQPAHG